jgi:hypothetical protein
MEAARAVAGKPVRFYGLVHIIINVGALLDIDNMRSIGIG